MRESERGKGDDGRDVGRRMMMAEGERCVEGENRESKKGGDKIIKS